MNNIAEQEQDLNSLNSLSLLLPKEQSSDSQRKKFNHYFKIFDGKDNIDREIENDIESSLKFYLSVIIIICVKVKNKFIEMCFDDKVKFLKSLSKDMYSLGRDKFKKSEAFSKEFHYLFKSIIKDIKLEDKIEPILYLFLINSFCESWDTTAWQDFKGLLITQAQKILSTFEKGGEPRTTITANELMYIALYAQSNYCLPFHLNEAKYIASAILCGIRCADANWDNEILTSSLCLLRVFTILTMISNRTEEINKICSEYPKDCSFSTRSYHHTLIKEEGIWEALKDLENDMSIEYSFSPIGWVDGTNSAFLLLCREFIGIQDIYEWVDNKFLEIVKYGICRIIREGMDDEKERERERRRKEKRIRWRKATTTTTTATTITTASSSSSSSSLSPFVSSIYFFPIPCYGTSLGVISRLLRQRFGVNSGNASLFLPQNLPFIYYFLSFSSSPLLETFTETPLYFVSQHLRSSNLSLYLSINTIKEAGNVICEGEVIVDNIRLNGLSVMHNLYNFIKTGAIEEYDGLSEMDRNKMYKIRRSEMRKEILEKMDEEDCSEAYILLLCINDYRYQQKRGNLMDIPMYYDSPFHIRRF